MSVMTPYHSELRPARRFTQLLRAEWTKFRTVRGWVIGMAVALLLIVGLGALTGANSECGISWPRRPALACPAPPTGPGRRAGHRPLLLRPPAAGRRRQHHRPGDVADRPDSTSGGFASDRNPTAG